MHQRFLFALTAALSASFIILPCTLGAEAPADDNPIAESVESSMDRTADPCVDFYRYACGGWLDSTELPSDQPRWARSFSVVNERNREVLRGMIEDAAANPGDDPDRQRVGSYYGACMDEETIEARGGKPLGPALAAIDGIEDPTSLFTVAGSLLRQGVPAFFSTATLPDFKDPGRNIGLVAQGGLGLPDRDYYLTEEKKPLLDGYRQVMHDLFVLLGDDESVASSNVEKVVAFETLLAEVSRPAEDMRMIERLYNKLDRVGLQELTPELAWTQYFEATGHPDYVEINVATPEFFEGLQKALAETDLATWKAYLRWNVVRSQAGALSSPFVDRHFEYFGRDLSGQKEIQPRWKRCVSSTGGALGEVLGRLFVAEYFAGDSKQIALDMIHDVEAAFEENLGELAWMDDETRKAALEKMNAIRNKIGYPDEWRDYSTLELDPEDHFGNLRRSAAFDLDEQMSKHGEPVDKDEWFLPPQVVNAFYNPLGNEIVFPAGILQVPFFSSEFPAAMNYGGIGSAMGHELTHGFDDSGRKFDPAGELREWWAPEVSERFEGRASCVEELYSGFEVEEDLHVNGQLTLGENIADVGGVKQAYQGYRRWVGRNGEPEPFIEDLSGDQLFFVAFAQNWCALSSPENARLLVQTDPHSPPRFRVLGTLSQVPAFAETFSCEAGQPMAPKERCEVW